MATEASGGNALSVSLCVVAWCAFTLGVPTDAPRAVSVARDVYQQNEVVDHLALVEARRVFAGFAWMGDRQAAIAGVLPLRVSWGRVALNGGISVASAPVPLRGTRANWIACGDVELTRHVGVRWIHLSNGGGASGHNPSLDALAVNWNF